MVKPNSELVGSGYLKGKSAAQAFTTVFRIGGCDGTTLPATWIYEAFFHASNWDKVRSAKYGQIIWCGAVVPVLV